MITLASFVSGEWRKGNGKPAALVDPTTEQTIAEASADGIDLAAARSFAIEHGGLRELSFKQRGELIGRMSKALHEARDALIDVSIQNAGTTRSDAKFDIDGGIQTLAFYAELGAKLGDARVTVEAAPELLLRGQRFSGVHARVPLRGVAVHINAFNFPVWGFAEKAACALLAGMPVITKPATSTALVAYRAVQKVIEANILPKGALSIVCGSITALLEHLGPQDVLAFTGSSDTAAKLRRLDAVVARSMRLNVEADSLNATVLMPDAAPGEPAYDAFIRDAVREITQKTGQKCTATRRIFVPEAMIDRVIEDLGERLAALKVGNPALDEVRMGPLATSDQLRDARAGIALLEKSGAKIVFGSAAPIDGLGVPAGKGYFMGPVLLRADDPHKAAAVHSHEVFGPVSTIMPIEEGGAEAAKLVALGGGGLVASAYGDDAAFRQALLAGITCHHGRVLLIGTKIADQAISPGLVLPSCIHGGPGRAGGGEELGGERGLAFYTQRVAIQGDRAVLDKLAL